jgi:hypothetical protein
VNALPRRTRGPGIADQEASAHAYCSLRSANAETWPASANVYDSLGEAQERAGALDHALTSYRRAAEIGRTTGDPNLVVYERDAERVAK